MKICCCYYYTSVHFLNISYLYQIAHLGDDDDEPEFSSAMPLEEGDTFFFAPRLLKNLVMVDELHSYAPILGIFFYYNVNVWYKFGIYIFTPLSKY